MSNGENDKGPLHLLHAVQAWILWISHVETPKSHAYAMPVKDDDVPHHRIVDAFQTIRKFLHIFQLMRRSMTRCSVMCTESHEGHFEHLPFQL
jgi:hypothetical protein